MVIDMRCECKYYKMNVLLLVVRNFSLHTSIEWYVREYLYIQYSCYSHYINDYIFIKNKKQNGFIGQLKLNWIECSIDENMMIWSHRENIVFIYNIKRKTYGIWMHICWIHQSFWDKLCNLSKWFFDFVSLCVINIILILKDIFFITSYLRSKLKRNLLIDVVHFTS